jgi:Protein of unknown function (DUF2794)
LDGQNAQTEGAEIIPLDTLRARRDAPVVMFRRPELDAILRIYSLMVGAGEWRDYALGHGAEKAVFAIFKRASEMPLFRIEKIPELARRQGAFLVRGADGRILKRGHDLAGVLVVLEKELKLANARKGRF